MSESAAPTNIVSTIARDEAIARARRVAVAVEPNIAEAESLRRMPASNVTAMMASELDRLLMPKRWGGYGSDDWMTLVDVVAEVARVCGSSGWCFCFLIHHHWVLGCFPEETQAEVFRTDQRPRIVTSFAPMGLLSRVSGGYRLSGEWSWGSGADHCNFAIVGAHVQPDGESSLPGWRFVLLSPQEFRIRDVWNSVGLKGSGSNNIVVNDVFIPEHRTLDTAAFIEGRSPGSRVNDGVLFHQPGFGAFAFGILSPLLGMARGALDAFVELTRSRINLSSGERTAQLGSIQRKMGESAAEIDAAYAIAKGVNGMLQTQLPLTKEQRIGARRDFAFASRLALRAVDRLFEAGGAHGLDGSHALQRFWRDAHAAANHAVFVYEPLYEAYGGHLLGLPPAPGTIF